MGFFHKKMPTIPSTAQVNHTDDLRGLVVEPVEVQGLALTLVIMELGFKIVSPAKIRAQGKMKKGYGPFFKLSWRKFLTRLRPRKRPIKIKVNSTH